MIWLIYNLNFKSRLRLGLWLRKQKIARGLYGFNGFAQIEKRKKKYSTIPLFHPSSIPPFQNIHFNSSFLIKIKM